MCVFAEWMVVGVDIWMEVVMRFVYHLKVRNLFYVCLIYSSDNHEECSYLLWEKLCLLLVSA